MADEELRQQAQSEQPQEPRSEKPTVEYMVVRKSAFFLAVQLIGSELLFVVFIALLIGLVFGGIPIASSGALILFAVLVGGVMLIKLALTFWFVTKWIGEFYEIRPSEIAVHRGIITKDKEVLSIKDAKSMAVHQDVFGKLFRFGTIRLYNPYLNEIVRLDNIPNPNKHMEMIGQLLPDLEPTTGVPLRQTGVGTS